MGVPLSQMWTVASYVMRRHWQGDRRYPLVLMLEPLFRCNLSCSGCGKTQYPSHILKRSLTVEECLHAVDECGVPVVSIAGGEPFLHSDLVKIAEGIVARKKYLYLCTNGILLREKIGEFRPSKYLTISVHLDGLEEDHDRSVCSEGVYEKATSGIEIALARGFRVTTNTTVYEGADPERMRRFFDEVMRLGVEGMMISPGYNYRKAPRQSIFLERKRSMELFRKILHASSGKWIFNQSPLFLEFLAGSRHFECTPWGSPTYNIFGWQLPCYLIEEGYARSFQELLEKTAPEKFGYHSGNPKCLNCMMHNGHEPTAVRHTFGSWAGFWETACAALFGPNIPSPTNEKFPLPDCPEEVSAPVAKQCEESPVRPETDTAV